MPDDQSASAEVMSVLRAHGWRSGVTQLLHRIEAESDAQRRAALRLRLGRSLADHGDYAQASTLLSAIEESDPCAAGARIGLAAIALREKRFDDAFALLDAAERLRAARSATLDGAESRSEAGEIAHLRGTVYFHTSSDRAARMHLLEALSLFDKGSARTPVKGVRATERPVSSASRQRFAPAPGRAVWPHAGVPPRPPAPTGVPRRCCSGVA